MRGKFVPNPLFENAITRTTGTRDSLEELAEGVADRYREAVPVDEGDVRDGVFSDVALTEDGYVGRVGNRDWKAGLVEFGTFEHRPDASLREALEAAGLEAEIQEDRYR